MKTFLSVLLMVLMHGTAYSQINKCVDASGKVVYSQAPCQPGQTSSVLGSPAPSPQAAPADAKPGGKPPPTPEEAFQQRQKARIEAEKKAASELAEQKQRQEGCERARVTLTQYEMGGRLSGVNANGERYFLDDEQVAREKARARQAVNEWCK